MSDLTLTQISDDLCGLIAQPWAQCEPEIQARIVNDINAAIQEINTLGPTHVRQRDEAFIAPAPVDLTGCTFTTRSKAWAAGSPSVTADQIGSGIVVSGDPLLNRIESATLLQAPVLSAGLSGNATIYGDCFPLPAGFISILGPVWINGSYKVNPMLNDEDRLQLIRADWLTNYYGQYNEYDVYRNWTRCYDQFFYWIENRGVQKYLRLWPGPSQDMRVTFKAEFGPETYTAAQVRQTSPNIVPPISAGQTEQILLPIVRKKFSGWIHFNSLDVMPEINFQYEKALLALKAMNPQRQTAAKIVAPSLFGPASPSGYSNGFGRY